jgi:glycerophosphoryl diester phosphodiesterase
MLDGGFVCRCHTSRIALAVAIAVAVAVGGCNDRAPVRQPARVQPFVATHRGDPARPENTLAAFRAALDEGAEYLETDLVPSKDGVLVLRHDRSLSATTDIEDHPEFADRRVTKTVRGRPVTDWWVDDFTVAELKTLRATVRNAAPSGRYRIPTLQELVDFVRREGAARGRRVGLYLETKEPETFKALGYDLEDMVTKTLRADGLDRSTAGVYVQSWDKESVREMSASLRIPVVQLVSASRRWNDELSASGLARLHDEGVDGLNVVDERLQRDPGLIERAHAAGLVIHGWGFGPGDDYGRWIRAGINGFITDDVPAALGARGRAASA